MPVHKRAPIGPVCIDCGFKLLNQQLWNSLSQEIRDLLWEMGYGKAGARHRCSRCYRKAHHLGLFDADMTPCERRTTSTMTPAQLDRLRAAAAGVAV